MRAPALAAPLALWLAGCGLPPGPACASPCPPGYARVVLHDAQCVPSEPPAGSLCRGSQSARLREPDHWGSYIPAHYETLNP